jgi:CBS domain-containing protein
VVDVLGRPVGVLSQTDIAIYYRNRSDAPAPAPEYYQRVDLTVGRKSMLATLKIDQWDRTLVHHVMTPTVIAVGPNDSVVRVVGEMVAFKIHRLFVVAEDGVLVGVISAFDVLRKLRAESEACADEQPGCTPYDDTLFDCRT